MTQFLLLLHKIFSFKIAAVLLTMAMVGGLVFQLSTVVKAHALNVHIQVKETPPGIAKIIENTGEPPPGIVNPEGNQITPFTIGTEGDPDTDPPGDNPPPGNKPTTQGGTQSTPPDETIPLPPGIAKIIQQTGAAPPGIVKLAGGSSSALFINTDIDFKTVFPEETLTQHFIVGLQGVTEPTGFGSPPWSWWGNTETYTYVCYKITVRAVSSSILLDLSDYITVTKATEDTETEPDGSATAPDDKVAWGKVDTNDSEDKWWVILDGAPDTIGDYECEIEVRVCHTDSGEDCPCETPACDCVDDD